MKNKHLLFIFLSTVAISLNIDTAKATRTQNTWISEGRPTYIYENYLDEQAPINEDFFYVDGYTVNTELRAIIDPTAQKNGSFLVKNGVLTYENTSHSVNFAPVYFFKQVFETTKSAIVQVKVHMDSTLALSDVDYYMNLALGGATFNQAGELLPDYTGNQSIQVVLETLNRKNVVDVYGYDGFTDNPPPDAIAPNSNLQDVTLKLYYDAPHGLVYASYLPAGLGPQAPFIDIGKPYDVTKYVHKTVPYIGFWITAGNYSTNSTVDVVGPGKIYFSSLLLNEWNEPIQVSIPPSSGGSGGGSHSKKKSASKSSVKKPSTKKKSTKKRK